MEAVERTYGPMHPLGYVRQEYYDRSLTEAELKRKTDTITGSVATVCDYHRRDARSTFVRGYRKVVDAIAADVRARVSAARK